MTDTHVREGQTFGSGSLAARYASFVKLPHTLFALPFAGVGAILATWEFGGNLTFQTAGWIVLAFTAARFAAMGFNRIVDRRYDALNPRTARRELPAGALSLTQAVTAVVAAAATFLVASFMLNPLCGMLAPVALFSTAALAGALYYLVHSTLTMAAMFLVADLVAVADEVGLCQPLPESDPVHFVVCGA